jgi:nucleoside-diphosphate-sugar epimerase
MAADSGNSKYLENYSRSINSSLMNLYCIDALHEAKDIGKVFLPSSFYVYGDACLYSLEKLYAELLFMHSPFDARIARLFPTYGPGAIVGGENEKVTTAMCRKIITANDFSRFVFKSSRLSPCRNFVYLDDAIRGIRMLMQSSKPTIVDLAGKEKISVSEVLFTAIEISGKEISVVVEDDMANIVYIEPDLENTQKKIGWFPFYSFRQGMEKLYDYVKENLNGLSTERDMQS